MVNRNTKSKIVCDLYLTIFDSDFTSTNILLFLKNSVSSWRVDNPSKTAKVYRKIERQSFMNQHTYTYKRISHIRFSKINVPILTISSQHVNVS